MKWNLILEDINQYWECKDCGRRVAVVCWNSRDTVDWNWINAGNWSGEINKDIDYLWTRHVPVCVQAYCIEGKIIRPIIFWKLYHKCKPIDYIPAEFERRPCSIRPLPSKITPPLQSPKPIYMTNMTSGGRLVRQVVALTPPSKIGLQEDYCHLIDAAYAVLGEEFGPDEAIRIMNRIKEKKFEVERSTEYPKVNDVGMPDEPCEREIKGRDN